MEQRLNFDQSDPQNLGRPLYWSLDEHVKAIEGMIRADEIEIAFRMCDEIPAWYRANYPKELSDIKRVLYQNLYSPMTYVNDDEEANYTYEQVVAQVNSGYCYPRLDILRNIVKAHNDKLNTPWIFELSTSHGPIPIGLKEQGLAFNFFAKNFNQAALAKVKAWLGDIWQEKPKAIQPTIFVNFESLEHAYREEDIKNDYHKLGVDFDYIVLSVPNGTLGHGLPNWQTRRLGHIRTYNAQEFFELADSFFPKYKWKMIADVSLVLVGEKAA